MLLRVALCGYLVLSLTVGQSLCCCSTARWLAAPAGERSHEQTAGKTRHVAGCCGHQTGKASGQSHPCREGQDQGRHCPCRDVKVVLAADESPAQQLLVRSCLPEPVFPLAVLTAEFFGASPAPEPDVNLPFLTAQDLLRAHHTLRC